MVAKQLGCFVSCIYFIGAILWYLNGPIQMKFEILNSKMAISGSVSSKGHYVFTWSSSTIEIADWLELLNSTHLESFYLFQPNNPRFSHFKFKGYYNQHRYYYDGKKYLFKPDNSTKYQYKISNNPSISSNSDHLELVYLSLQTPNEIYSDFHKYHLLPNPSSNYQPKSCLHDEILPQHEIDPADHKSSIWLQGSIDTLIPNYHKEWKYGGIYHEEPYYYRMLFCDKDSYTYCKYKYMLTAKYLYGYKEDKPNVLDRYCIWNEECLWFYSNMETNGPFVNDTIDYEGSRSVYCPVMDDERNMSIGDGYYVRYRRYMVRREDEYYFWWDHRS